MRGPRHLIRIRFGRLAVIPGGTKASYGTFSEWDHRCTKKPWRWYFQVYSEVELSDVSLNEAGFRSGIGPSWTLGYPGTRRQWSAEPIEPGPEAHIIREVAYWHHDPYRSIVFGESWFQRDSNSAASHLATPGTTRSMANCAAGRSQPAGNLSQRRASLTTMKVEVNEGNNGR